jgi:uncharacterized protein (DUF58 family)
MGWWYMGFAIVIGFAGVNTGNNLLFLLFGLLLAGIVLSGVLSESTLRAMAVERVPPTEATAGQPVLVGIRIRNHKRKTASYAVVVRDVTAQGTAGQGFSLVIEGGHTREVTYRWEPQRRGRVSFQRIQLATRYPFGLFEKWRELDAPFEAVVFPREVTAPTLRPRRAAPLGERPSGHTGPGTEFFAMRDLRLGDDARAIHWLTSARRGRPVVVERERERRQRICVVIDNRREALPDGSATNAAETLDRIVELAAALVRRAGHEGCEVALAASGEVVPAGAGPAHERRILRVLALLTVSDSMLPPVPVAGAEILDVGPSVAMALAEAGAAA